MNKPTPHDIQALFVKGIEAHKAGDFIGAKTLYSEALNFAPNDINILQNLGSLHFMHGRYLEAAAYFGRALEIGQVPVGVLRSLAASLTRCGKHIDALRAYTAYREHEPNDFDLTLDYLQTLFALNKFSEILGFCKLIPPAHKHSRIAMVYGAEAEMALGQVDEAIIRLETALQHWPDHIDLLPAMGKAYSQARQFDKALECQQKSVDLQPDEGMHWNNLGNALKNTGHNAKAAAAFAKARALKPQLAGITLTNEAYIYKREGRLDKAIETANEALVIDPLNTAAHYAYGTLSLMAQNYEEAWPHLEWRWHKQDPAIITPPFPLKLWHGEDTTGKTLAIYSDQGIGDTIQMLRYLPLIKADTNIVVYTQKKLAGIFTQNYPHIKFIASDEKSFRWNAEDFDYIVAFCSLPYIFKTSINTIPAQTPLKAAKEINYKTPEKPLVVGLSWFTKSLDAGYKRSLSLKDFARLNKTPGVQFIDLQYGDTSTERADADANGFNLHHDTHIDQWSDIQSFIDQIHACDIVISIDNTTVHAAGAAGVPVWTILPNDPYWRWHPGQDGNPWYKTMRLFSQNADGDFTPALETIQGELQKLAAGDTSALTPAPFVPCEQKQQATKNALLVNDTSAWYHWGCTATSEAMIKEITARGFHVESAHHRETADNRMPAPNIKQFDDPSYLAEWRYNNPSLFAKIENTDAVIFNGEGTIHGLRDNALRLLYIGYVAKTVFKKPLHIINHACFPFEGNDAENKMAGDIYKKTYALADSVVVRDIQSQQALATLGVEAVAGFDSLPLRARDWLAENPATPNTSKTILLAGSSIFSAHAVNALHRYIKKYTQNGYRFECLIGAKHHTANDDHDFIEALKQAPAPVTIYHATSLHDWFSKLQGADLLVSGRFHYSIAAACLGTPFIAFEGNTPKLHALCDLLGEKAPLNYDNKNIYDSLCIRTSEALHHADETKAGVGARLDTLCTLALKNYASL